MPIFPWGSREKSVFLNLDPLETDWGILGLEVSPLPKGSRLKNYWNMCCVAVNKLYYFR